MVRLAGAGGDRRREANLIVAEQHSHRDFIRANTQLAPPPACQEILLHLATAITPMWLATETEMHLQNLPPPYWAFAWAGGQGMARHILDSPWIVRGRKVLDFAAGSGIAAVAAAKAGAATVEATDIDLVAVEAIRLNAAANGVEVTAHAGDATSSPTGLWDVVLAGDVCYERPMVERCFPWLQRLAAQGAMVLLADPGRAYLPAKGLVRLAEYAIPTSREIEDRDVRETVIYRVEG
jgi:predicted nicotinamide N-methyase